MALLALVAILATRLRHIALDCPIGIIVSIEFVSSAARVTSIKSQQLPQFERLGPIDWTLGIPGFDKKDNLRPGMLKQVDDLC